MKETTAFNHYLQKQGYKPSTIQGHINDVKRLQTWAESKDIETIAQLRYSDIMAYIAEQKEQHLNIATINQRLNSLRKYYEHLKAEGDRDDNPARRLHVKGRIKKAMIAHDYKELETLYTNYAKYLETKPMLKEWHKTVHQRNLIMLGLIIWQGLNGGEFRKMETGHVNLNAGTIYIPSSYRADSRELRLDPRQIISLHQYIEAVKTQQPKGENKLFIGNSFYNQVKAMSDEIRGLNPAIKNLEDIRASVIMYWIKAYGKRTAQYMAGHRYVSSTERYEQQNIEELIDQLTKHHPFG